MSQPVRRQNWMKGVTMPTFRARMAGAAFAVALLATACSSSSDYAYVDPASVEEVSADLWRIELTPKAAERTGLETTEVVMEDIDGNGDRLMLPYSSIMYHYDGSTWTYTNPEPLTYVRAPIEIDYIDDGMVVLAAGPPEGTVVVSVGAAELYGVEFGIGK